MLSPFLQAWVEQRNKLAGLRVDGSNVTALPGIAAQASKSEVLEYGHSFMLPGNDVVYLVGRVGIIFVQQAIFASISSALRNEAAKFFRNISCQAECFGGPAPWPE